MAGDNNRPRRLDQVPLVREFLADHQEMSRLMLKTLTSLENDDFEAAVASAQQLDQVSGAHIAFEEAELYPRVRGQGQAPETTDHLYDEHKTALAALRTLLDNPQPDPTTKQQIIDGLRTGVDHAEHCGTLVSILAALPELEQQSALAALLAFREEGYKWTDRS